MKILSQIIDNYKNDKRTLLNWWAPLYFYGIAAGLSAVLAGWQSGQWWRSAIGYIVLAYVFVILARWTYNTAAKFHGKKNKGDVSPKA